MKKTNYELSWIEKNNQEMQEWVIKYLLKKGISIQARTWHDDIINSAQNWSENAETREILKTMNGAWRQKKLRERQDGRKASNFIISISAKRKLKALAFSRKTNMTETLEWLIQSTSEIKDQYKIQAKIQNEDYFKRLRSEQNAASLLASKLSKTLTELCKLQLQIESLNLDQKSLPTPPQEELEKLFNAIKISTLSTNSIFDAEDIRKYKKMIKPISHSQTREQDDTFSTT